MGGVIGLVIVILVAGFCWWLVEQYVPSAGPFRVIARAVIAVAAIIFLLHAVGIDTGLRMPRL